VLFIYINKSGQSIVVDGRKTNLSKFETRLSLMLSHSNNDIKIVMLTGSLTFIVYTIIMMVLFVVVWSIYFGCHF